MLPKLYSQSSFKDNLKEQSRACKPGTEFHCFIQLPARHWQSTAQQPFVLALNQ